MAEAGEDDEIEVKGVMMGWVYNGGDCGED